MKTLTLLTATALILGAFAVPAVAAHDDADDDHDDTDRSPNRGQGNARDRAAAYCEDRPDDRRCERLTAAHEAKAACRDDRHSDACEEFKKQHARERYCSEHPRDSRCHEDRAAQFCSEHPNATRCQQIDKARDIRRY